MKLSIMYILTRACFCAVASLMIFVQCTVCAQTDQGTALFETEIRPVLVSKCLSCHGASKQEGSLRLDSQASLLDGGDSGSAIIAGKPDESLLIEALKYESYEMPPSGQLDDHTIEQFEKWIATGALWPADSKELREDTGHVTESDRQWWVFQPVETQRPPTIEGDTWSKNPIDRFVMQKLVDQEMRPAPSADKATLVRRLYFDLIGLPPSDDEFTTFLADTAPNAWESRVDRLLRDPRYGEHWARHWLDLVRYSESDGWNQDAYRPELWRYRDYVVNAFNDDKPYPEFVREQLAGDEMPGDDPQRFVAAGFLRLGIYEYNQRDARSHWDDIMNEMTDVTGDVFLGLSMACARCHDHKFDAIPQKDYFKLRAFFEPLSWRDDIVAATDIEKHAYAEELAVWEEATKIIRRRIDALLKPYYDRKWESTVDKFPLDIQACFHMPVAERTSWQNQMAYMVERQFLEEGGGPLKSLTKEDKAAHDALNKELEAFDDIRPKPLPHAMTVTDFAGLASPTYIPSDSARTSIEPGFLEVMKDVAAADIDTAQISLRPTPDTSGRRTALAEWIGDPSNPLTTRVFVNRIWQQHFGQGIVATPNDFGTQGEGPTHPELLDWLTSTYVSQGWSLKRLHKQIVMSATWQQSSVHPQAAEYQLKDPAESLLWRSRVRRLQAEQIRDAMLFATGELDGTVGGPSVTEDQPRRALYTKSFRNKNDTFLHGFDVANGLKSVATRDTTTTPTQALLLINGQYAMERAKKMAERLESLHLVEQADMFRAAYQIVWAREPNTRELQSAYRFVGLRTGEDSFVIDSEKLVDFCHVLFNSNQFLYFE